MKSIDCYQLISETLDEFNKQVRIFINHYQKNINPYTLSEKACMCLFDNFLVNLDETIFKK